jgi:hypothetical protein
MAHKKNKNKQINNDNITIHHAEINSQKKRSRDDADVFEAKRVKKRKVLQCASLPRPSNSVIPGTVELEKST